MFSPACDTCDQKAVIKHNDTKYYCADCELKRLGIPVKKSKRPYDIYHREGPPPRFMGTVSLIMSRVGPKIK